MSSERDLRSSASISSTAELSSDEFLEMWSMLSTVVVQLLDTRRLTPLSAFLERYPHIEIEAVANMFQEVSMLQVTAVLRRFERRSPKPPGEAEVYASPVQHSIPARVERNACQRIETLMELAVPVQSEGNKRYAKLDDDVDEALVLSPLMQLRKQREQRLKARRSRMSGTDQGSRDRREA